MGRFAHSLRTRLYLDYLGLADELKELVVDPVGVCGMGLWQQVSRNNTKIYENVFPSSPK